MHRILFNLIFIALLSPQLFSQTPGHLIGIYCIPSPAKSTYGIADVDPATGIAIPLDTFVGYQATLSASGVFDGYRNFLYMITADSINTYLMSVNIATGQISVLFEVDSTGSGIPGTVTVGNCLSELCFNYSDSNIYFLHLRNRYATVQYLSKINPVTKEVTDLTTLPVYWSEAFPLNPDCNHQKIFFQRYDRAEMRYSIGTYDLVNNSFDSVALDRATDANVTYTFTFNPNDNFFYGYEQDRRDFATDNLSALRMVRVDPLTGSIGYLTPVSRVNAIGEIMDPVLNRNYFMAQTTNPGMLQLDRFDIATNTLTSKPFGHLNNNPDSWVQVLDFITSFDQQPASDFTFSNVCQSFPTAFSPNVNGGYFLWTFGDPASGNANESILANPDHTFSEAGTYGVTMIAYTCYKSDTVTRLVTIEPFPHIGLGTDTVLCSNQPHLPLELDVTVAGYHYVWQDESTLPTFTITQPGTYWVNVSGSCGNISDTLNVSSQICDCGITLLPNLTEHTISIHIDCEVTTYHHLHLELFDMLGRKVMDRPVSKNDFAIDINRFSAGAFGYRFRDDNHTIQTGKLVVIH